MRAGSALARLAIVVLTGLALTAVAACGGGDDSRPAAAGAGGSEEGEPVGPEYAGSVVQYADCDDWRKGSAADRRSTVVELRRQLTPQTSKTAASSLADERAYEILQKACKPSYSGSLRLYKLYVRAQAFAPLND